MVAVFTGVNRFVPWYRLPTLLGVANLAAFRISLRQHNLFHPTEEGQQGPIASEPPKPELLAQRSDDGRHNDPQCPMMGARGTRFGRNVPFSEAHPEVPSLIMTPNPRLVAERLLTRRSFKKAADLNLLAAGWIQFQIHDWFNHAPGTGDETLDIPLDAADPWDQERPMRIARSGRDPTRCEADERAGLPPTFTSTESHWWDASAIYSTKTIATGQEPGGGQLGLDGELLPWDDEENLPLTGFTTNWWIGLEMLHTLFVREHNAIARALREEYPDWDHARLLHTARLINSALMAKIHTVEWTTAILPHPTMRRAMRANWWGLLGERVVNMFGIRGHETLCGIPGSATDHHGVPFSLTEEFTSVYRMHPLLPDEIRFKRLDGDAEITLAMEDVLGPKARQLIDSRARATFGRSFTMADLFHTFGVNHPGALSLQNYPSFLRRLSVAAHEVDGVSVPERIVDVATIDIMRDRERGVPRYNRMRRLLRMKPVTSFEEITGERVIAREMREVYNDDLESVDLMIGMLGEQLIKDFGFSETAFRIFILMASRRLKSDRFFTSDFNAKVYSEVGMRWIAENNMTSILLRHHPELAPALEGCENAFKPWPHMTGR